MVLGKEILVEIAQEHKGHMERIMDEMDCPKAFECYKSGLTRLGKVQGIGKSGFLECLEENSQNCQFSLPFGNPSLCLCPVRIYIATEFRK